MLTARLQERCESAMPLGLAHARGYSLVCNKLGRDGSGKATLVAAKTGAFVHGVLFRIRSYDRPALDRAEGGYHRHDTFEVYANSDGQTVSATTYIAPPESCSHELKPFDWYVALILAGSEEHGIAKMAMRGVSELRSVMDGDTERAQSMFALINSG